MINRRRAPLTGLVLSGGGARGAYEAGVMRYIRDELPPWVRAHVRFEIISGTSVGGINCCFLAANNHAPDIQGRSIVEMWEKLRIESIYKLGWREIKNLPKFLLGTRGRGELDQLAGPGRLGGLFNTSPLEQLVKRKLNWKNIAANLASGDLKALALSATHMRSGQTHVFVQQQGGGLPPWSTDPQIQAKAVEIGPAHALASAAIPWIFPAVEVDGEVYCDGGLKLNTPISPALRLGADRLLVLGLRSEQELLEDVRGNQIDSYPSAAFLLGKILSALLLDKTDYDVMRLERFNALMAAGEKEFGDKFPQSMAGVMTKLRGAPYRQIDTVVVRPSESIATIAGRHLEAGSIAARAPGIVGPILRRMRDIGGGQAWDLLSFLLFDGEYARDLIELGMRDADAQRQRLIEFFSV